MCCVFWLFIKATVERKQMNGRGKKKKCPECGKIAVFSLWGMICDKCSAEFGKCIEIMNPDLKIWRRERREKKERERLKEEKRKEEAKLLKWGVSGKPKRKPNQKERPRDLFSELE